MNANKTKVSDPVVIHQKSPYPEAVPALQAVFQQAASAGLQATVILRPAADETADSALKRRHDIRSALRTLDLSVKALTAGYRFDDNQSTAKIAAIARAVQCLEREFDLACALLVDE